ncbi:MAG: DUF4870 domain-containing protein [Kouleothrix sp.]|jgi:uncharacterized Tic20 family protein|nr:DUF4870 domain-containing protein [Kouleothrix sp.]
MQPNDDERMLAALAHASIIANTFNLAGMLATLLIWATQRERSAYVRVHALQSLLYQGLVLLISLAIGLLWGLCVVVSLLPAAVRPDLYRSSPPNSFWVALLGLVVPLGFGLLATLYGLYGAYQVYRGRPFRYPLAGRVTRGVIELPARPAPAAKPPAPAPETAPAAAPAPEAAPAAAPAPEAAPAAAPAPEAAPATTPTPDGTSAEAAPAPAQPEPPQDAA